MLFRSDTVINGGTISGSNGLAVDLGGGDDTLVLLSLNDIILHINYTIR